MGRNCQRQDSGQSGKHYAARKASANTLSAMDLGGTVINLTDITEFQHDSLESEFCNHRTR
jgi:hypothetical protein